MSDTTYWVYAIASLSRNYIYVGLTDDLDRRVKEHNYGYNKTTQPYRPFRLNYSETSIDRPSARSREKYWKGGSGKRKLKKLRYELLS